MPPMALSKRIPMIPEDAGPMIAAGGVEEGSGRSCRPRSSTIGHDVAGEIGVGIWRPVSTTATFTPAPVSPSPWAFASRRSSPAVPA